MTETKNLAWEVQEAELAASNTLTYGVDKQVKALSKIEEDLGNVLTASESDIRQLWRLASDAALKELPDNVRDTLAADVSAFAEFMTRLVAIDPETATNSSVQSSLATLAQVKAARTQLRQVQKLVQQAIRLATSITVKIASAGLL